MGFPLWAVGPWAWELLPAVSCLRHFWTLLASAAAASSPLPPSFALIRPSVLVEAAFSSTAALSSASQLSAIPRDHEGSWLCELELPGVLVLLVCIGFVAG